MKLLGLVVPHQVWLCESTRLLQLWCIGWGCVGFTGFGVGSVAVGLGRVGFYIVRSRFLRRSRVPQFGVPLGFGRFLIYESCEMCCICTRDVLGVEPFANVSSLLSSYVPAFRGFHFHVFRRVVVPFARFTSKEF